MTEDLNKLWLQALSYIKDEIASVGYSTWIEPLKPLEMRGGTVWLSAQNSFMKDMIESRYNSLILNSIRMADSSVTKVNIVSGDETVPEEAEKSEPASEFSANHTNMNPKYTFDRFVIGENNRFAHAACVAVAEAPSQKYNPLFIYGGVGLGKTHLMQAIGNYVLELGADRKVVYVSCEDFTNEFINSIQTNKNNEFRMKYRRADFLLIDDIQFLTGKEGTQEAFFHTFNTLYEANKQIVISSDRPPKEIPKLEDRLRSRFEMGLITDISAPNFETRMAILRKKAESYEEKIPDAVLSYIAEHIHSNIRELEGALTRVTAYANLHNQPVTLDISVDALRDMLSDTHQEINIPYIKAMTAKYFDITPGEMDSKKRTKKITQPRQVAMYLSRELTDNSFPKIGEAFGGRDHSTVVHACQKVSDDIQERAEFAKLVSVIKKEITGKSE